jgi:hypothetical protein
MSSAPGDETILVPDETILTLGKEIRKHGMVINAGTKAAPGAQGQTGDSQMRTTSFILAFAFVLAGPSMAGSADTGMPGIGTFSYNGSPVTSSHTLVVAGR